MKNIIVRPATIKDTDTIVKFNMEMAQETEEITLSREKLLSGVTAVFKDTSKGFYLVAEYDGKVVGQAMITYEWSDWRNSVFWWIQSVYVLPDHRRIGVFSSIFSKIKSMAEGSSSVCGLRLYVDKNNHLAKRVYKNFGLKGSHYELYESSLLEEI